MATRAKMIKQIKLMLGSEMIEVELDSDHLNLSIDLAIERYRMRSEHSMEESFIFFTLERGIQDYTLPDEVQEVRKLYRRGVGGNSGISSNYDPFELSFTNTYLLQAGRSGGLATFDFFSQFQETVGRIFGTELNFVWEHSTRNLKVIRRLRHDNEEVMVHVWNQKPEATLLNDPYSVVWLRDYATARSKMMLGEARSKFTSGLPGPGGSVTLNGEQLKAEAAQEMDRLELELQNYSDGSSPLGFVIG